MRHIAQLTFSPNTHHPALMLFLKAIRRSLLKLKMIQNPAGERNKIPILGVLQKYINKDDKFSLLEISSGPGLHSSFYGTHFPNITFQPSELNRTCYTSIKAYRELYRVQNVLDPVFIDISQEMSTWATKLEENSYDFMLNINMIHISPFRCTEGLFMNAAKLLKPSGLLFTYGSYAHNGVLEPMSNVLFNQRLMAENPEWGVRDIVDLKKVAESNSIELIEIVELPGNNKCLVWKLNK